MKSCYLCGNNEHKCREGKVRDNDNLDILECTNCKLVYLSDFSHIQNQFYENTGMHNGNVDLDKWLKATEEDDERRFQDFKNKIKNKSVLDFGCGNGGFLIRAKNLAKSVTGIELDKSILNHFSEQGITVYQDINQTSEKYDVITMFHVIEHLDEPHKILQKLSHRLNKGGKIIIETPNSEDALLSIYKSKAFSQFTYWSCHLYLFNEDTLAKTIKKSDLKAKNIKIYQKQRYPFSNHLYWILKSKPGGHKKWSFWDKFIPTAFYEKILGTHKACDTIIAEITL